MSDTQIIETGDSVKVKQVLDDAAMEAVRICFANIFYHQQTIECFSDIICNK
jgi:hypothetical protein